ncbi:transmembrane protease serine 11D isoform X2 [Haematobia irritans]|uniref:transmembrane protease serine 11D isoform X2 n=1 Tax=Haematobia irritans TaxID=7368 RepID=UPI003F4F47C9
MLQKKDWLFIVSACVALQYALAFDSKIVNGTLALPGEFPYMVSLQLVRRHQHFCAGTILNQQWIITAAHCFTFIKTPQEFLVQYGSNELRPKNPQYENVEAIHIHEGYSATIALHDIALVKLRNSIKFNENVHKVQLNEDNGNVYDNLVGTLIGWGLNETMVNTLPSKLNRVSLQILSLSACRTQLKSVVHKTNICAGGNGRGQCSGDSGGPLMLDDKQIGLVSWSIKPCGHKPGIFTNIRYYLDWIKETIGSI